MNAKTLSRNFLVATLAAGLVPALHAADDAPRLTQNDVGRIIAATATKARQINPDAVIAVTDREGFVLGVFDVGSRVPSPLPAFSFQTNTLRTYGLVAAAVSRAGTAAFLSSNANAFTSRTAGYIIQQHFPPGVRNSPPGPLVGVGFSNLFYTDINRFKQIPPGFDPSKLNPGTFSPGVRGNPVLLTSLNDAPGGVPLYIDNKLVGGLGVCGDGSRADLSPAAAILLGKGQKEATPGFKPGPDTDELCALAGQTGYRPDAKILATEVVVGGIRLPYTGIPAAEAPEVENPDSLFTLGRIVDGYPVQASPEPFPYPIATLGDEDGELRIPIRDDPLLADPKRARIGKALRLNAAEVRQIIDDAAARCRITRAAIRLPLGTAARVWIVVVNNPNKPGEMPAVLGTFRCGEAPLFSWDVATQKARTAVFFSNSQLAMSSRTVGFLAQRFFPPGLDNRPPGPFFGFQEAVTFKQAPKGGFPGNTNVPNGITIFPGGFPLYRKGQLIGAIGVSGDGIDQDDIIGASGSAKFAPKANIRADQYTYRGARLPYAKFPRDPVK